jgi:hypothetical protein
MFISTGYNGTNYIDINGESTLTLGKADTGGSAGYWNHGNFVLDFVFNVKNTGAYIIPSFSKYQEMRGISIVVDKL